MMDPVLGDYARNLPDARESKVLSLFAIIINKYVFICDLQFIGLFVCESWWLFKLVGNMASIVALKIIFLFKNLLIIFPFCIRYKAAMIDDVPRIFEAVF